MFRVRSVLVLLLTAIGQNTCIAQSSQDSAFDLSVGELQQIIQGAAPSDLATTGLNGYLRLDSTVGMLRVDRDGQTDSSLVKASTLVSPKRYLIINYEVLAEKKTYTDVVAYDLSERLYHRWRVQDGRLLWKLVGVGNMESARGRGQSSPTELSVSWTNAQEVDQRPENTILVVEKITRSDRSLNGTLGWDLVHIAKDKMVHNESATFRGMLGDFSGEERRLIVATPPKETEPAKPWWEGLISEPEKSQTEIPQVDAGTEKADYRFEADRFVLRNPGRRFVSLSPQLVNPAARLVLTQTVPRRTILIIPEEISSAAEVSALDVIPVSKEFVRAGSPTAKIVDLEPTRLGEQQYYSFLARVEGLQPTTQVNSVLVANNHIYQIITIGVRQSREEALEFHRSTLRDFQVVQPARGVIRQELLHEDKEAGLTIDWNHLKVTNVEPWGESVMRTEIPAADAGVVFDGGWAFAMTMDLSELSVSDETLDASVASIIGGVFPDDVLRSQDVVVGPARGRDLDMQVRTLAGTRESARIRVVRNGDFAAAVVVRFTGSSSKSHQETLTDILAAAKFESPTPSAAAVPEAHKAMWPNQIGLQYFVEAEYRNALTFFQFASALAPSDRTLHSNIALSLLRLERFEEALVVVDNCQKKLGNDRELMLIKTEILVGLGKENEAIDLYASLHRDSPLPEDDLVTYVRVLGSIGKTALAAEVAERHMASVTSPRVALRQWFIETLTDAERYDDAIAQARKLIRDFPRESQFVITLAQALVDAERSEEALREIGSLKKNAEPTAGMFFVEGQCYLQMKQYAKAKEAFEAALVRLPGNPTLEDAVRTASVLLGQGDNSSIKTPISPVQLPQIVKDRLASFESTQNSEGFGYRPLLSWTGVEFQKGKKLKQTDYREIRIRTQAAVDQHKLLSVEFDPTKERLYVNRLEVLDADGKVVSTGRISDYYLTTADQFTMVTAQQAVNLPVPGLKPGRILRYQYTREDVVTSDVFPFRRRGFGQPVPGGPRAYFVSGDVKGLIRSEAPEGVTFDHSPGVMSWVCSSPPMLHLEARMPDFESFLPFIWVGETGETWQQLGDDYLKRIAPQLRPSAEAAAQAKRIVKDLPADDSEESQAARAKAIVTWIQNEFTYQALAFGIRGTVPNDVDRILTNRFGDCKDLSLLAWQMLKSQGIDCDLCLIDGDVPLVPEVPSMDQFNHMIIVLPGISGGTFVDCTQQSYAPFQTATAGLPDADVLILNTSGIQRQKIPSDKHNNPLYQSQRVVTLTDDLGGFDVEEKLTIHGTAAAAYRSFFQNTNAADLKDNFQGALTGRDRLKIKSLRADQVSNPEQPFVIQVSYRVENATTRSESRLTASLPSVWENYNFEEISGYRRKSPFELKVPSRMESTVTFRIPEQFTMATKPSAGNEDSKWVQASRLVSVKTGSVTLTVTLAQKQGVYPAEEFEDFQDATNSALKLFSPELSLVRIGEPD